MVDPSESAQRPSSTLWFGPERTPALEDFWSVYEATFDEINAATLALAAGHAEFGPLVGAMSPAQLAAQRDQSKANLLSAIRGGWSDYEDSLRSQGGMYAQMGISFRGWYDIAGAFHGLLVPKLVAAYGSDPPRLVAALLIVQDFVDRAMTTIGESYLEAKESSIRHAEAHNNTILQSSLDPIVTMDDAGHITSFNHAAERVFARTSAETVGKELASVIIPERFRDSHRDGLARYRATEESAIIGRRIEVVAMRSDGREFPVEIAIVRTSDNSGKPAFTGFLRDLSERQRTEAIRARSEDLEVQNRRVQEASRLKSEFLANMSHELRTPLNAIIGFTELLHNGEVDPSSPEHDEFLGDILRSAHHLLQLINDVLDLAKVEAGKLEFFPEKVKLENPVGEVLAILRTTAGARQIRTAVEIDPAIGELCLDPSRLKQVLYNYLSNALKFTNEGGVVTIRAKPEGPEAFRLEVADTGSGIAPADLPRLFVEFQQLDGVSNKRQGGTGLGLALTKRLVEAQTGTVGVTSEVGKGSTFYAVLPRQAVVHRMLPDPIKVPSAGPAGRRVLVVEDDSRDQAAIVHTLRQAGYAIETAATGAQALARCKETRFDAITLDLLLPDMNGLDVLREIRRGGKCAKSKVVVVTVVAEREAVAGFAVDDIIGKPIDEETLLNALRRSGVVPDSADHILVVDDDGPSLRLMQTTLSQLGYGVTCASDGEAALAAASIRRPSAVVLDLVMPRVDGFEFLARFRAIPANKAVPVIVWTVKDLTGEEMARLRTSAERIIQKGREGTANLVDELRRMFVTPRRGSSGSIRRVEEP